MNAYTPIRFVARRETTPTQGPEGPRIEVVEHWSDGRITRRLMGPRETAAHLAKADR